jgi:hypothetical protein
VVDPQLRAIELIADTVKKAGERAKLVSLEEIARQPSVLDG